MSLRIRLTIAVTLALVLSGSLTGLVLLRNVRSTLTVQVDQQVLANGIGRDHNDVGESAAPAAPE